MCYIYVRVYESVVYAKWMLIFRFFKWWTDSLSIRAASIREAYNEK